MRLTLDVIGSAEQLCGPNKERIISLRGLKVPAIENIGATGDLFDVLDLSDNSLIRLDNFPPLKRLETLLVANNRLAKLDADVLVNLPRLKSLILTNNRLALLGDLVPLTKAKHLERLSLLENPVKLKPHYKDYLIFRIPSLRYLDFCRIKDADRLRAKELFSGTAGATLLSQIEGDVSKERLTQDTQMQEEVSAKKPVLTQPQQTKSQLTPAETAKIREAIECSTNLSEIQRLEAALQRGECPPEFKESTAD